MTGRGPSHADGRRQRRRGERGSGHHLHHPGIEDIQNIPEFHGVRTDTYAYVEYLDGDRELYDLRHDPYELTNVSPARPHATRIALSDELLAVAGCGGRQYRAGDAQPVVGLPLPAGPGTTTLGAHVPHVPSPARIAGPGSMTVPRRRDVADRAGVRTATTARRVVARLTVAAALCAVLLVVLAAVFVETRPGQRLDNAALSGRVVQHPRTAARSERLLQTISVGSLAFLGVAIMAVALARGRGHLALGAGAVILGANVTTEVFKTARPPTPPRGQCADLVQHAPEWAQHRGRVARGRPGPRGPGPAPSAGRDPRRSLRRGHRGDDARRRLAPSERRGERLRRGGDLDLRRERDPRGAPRHR